MYLIINWVLSSASLLALATLLPGFRVTEFESAMIAAGIVGLISAALGTLLKHAVGRFSVSMSAVFLFIVDAFLFRVAALLVPGFAMRGFVPAVCGAVALLALNLFLLKYVAAHEEAFEPGPPIRS